MTDRRISIPSVVPLFKSYHLANPAWGSLHIVLDDGNVQDSSVVHCLQHALDVQDHEGAALAVVLLQMTKTQRRKLPHVVAAA